MRVAASADRIKVVEVERVVAEGDAAEGLGVEQTMGCIVQLGDLDPHRRVDGDGHRRHLAVLEQSVEVVEDGLRATDGECGDEQVPAAVDGALQGRGELVARVGGRAAVLA